MTVQHIQEVFSQAGCRGWLCARSVQGDGEVSIGADELVAPASVFKVAVALEVFRQIAAGRLDPRQRIRLLPETRTTGPTGFSTFTDEVEASLQDLARMMLTISDNAATDALIDRVGLDQINATLAALGLTQTVLTGGVGFLIDTMAQDAGFANWAELTQWEEGHPSAEAAKQVRQRLLSSRGLQPAGPIRTTPREMATLLRLIWRDEAGPPEACASVRALMAQQVIRQRLTAGFPPQVAVAAKSGTLIGVIRNEVGIASYPDGQAYAAAVFTRAHEPWKGEAAINAAIGRAAALAVEELRAR